MTIGLIDDDSIAVSQQMIPISILESALLVAKIKGFENLDQYIISLIENDLISIREGGQGFREFGERLAEYLDKIDRLQKLYPSISNPKEEEENDDLGLPSKEDVESRFGKIPPEEEDDNKEDLK
jgi:hypothetical protein